MPMELTIIKFFIVVATLVSMEIIKAIKMFEGLPLNTQRLYAAMLFIGTVLLVYRMWVKNYKKRLGGAWNSSNNK